MRQIDDPQYLTGLASMLVEIVDELDALPVRNEETVGSWLALHDAATLSMAAAIIKRLGLWAKYPDAPPHDRRTGRHSTSRRPSARPRRCSIT